MSALERLSDTELATLDIDRVALVANNLGLTDEWVLNQLANVVEAGLQGTPVYNRDGEQIGNQPQLGAVNNALHTLAQARGMLREQHDHHHDGGIEIRIVGVNTNQLT